LDEIPFIGRDQEYAWLDSQWKDPTQRVILLAGEAGIGKSRLSTAFAGYIQAQGARVLSVRLAPDKQTPTSAILEALRNLITTAALDQLTPATLAALAQHFPDLHQQAGPLPRLTPLPPQAERQRFTQAISALARWCATEPTLLIVDDAHRLNDTAVALLTQLHKHIKLMLTFREEETPSDHPLRRTFGSAGLTLKPLPHRAIQEIILQLSGDLHPGLADQISTLSRGNPLFMVALLQQMFETGQLFVNPNGAWELTNQDAPALPSTLQAALEAHLQKLDRSQRRIMDYAAVMGGEFDFDLMQTASQQAEDLLLSILDNLLDSALLIENRSPSQAEFRISHDRYTEITYKTIPAVRRKRLHLQIAQALETLYADQLAKHYAPLADHYHEALQPEPAAQYAALAGEQAAVQFAGYEALHYFNLALSLLPPKDYNQRARLLLAREQVYDLGGMRAEQESDLSSLQAISTHLPLALQAEIELRLGAFEWIMGRNPQAKSAVEKAIGHAQASKDKLIEARALLIAGKAASDGVSQAVPYLEQARILAHKIGQRALEGESVRWLGNINFWQNNYEESHTHLAEALAIHREVGDFRGELSALNNLGHLFEVLGQLQKAVQFHEQALDICQKIGDRLAEGVILTNIGGLRTQLGHFAQAQDDLQRALVIRSEIGNDEGVAVVYHDLGDIFRYLGQYQFALNHYQKAVEINTRIQHAWQKGGALTALSALYRDMGDHKRAREYLDQALLELSDQDAPHYIRALVEESLLNHLLGEHAQALTLAERALAKSAELPPLKAAAYKNAGHALAGLQRWEDAQEHYLKARDLQARLGQHHLTAEPLAGLARIALINADLAAASAFTESILNIIEKGSMGGPDRRLWIYLTCWEVMGQTGDSRAGELIERAYALLHQCAASISEDAARTAYLERISENRQIARIWQGLHPSK
jgi:tetratricopeptide (TPR) repeat protein